MHVPCQSFHINGKQFLLLKTQNPALPYEDRRFSVRWFWFPGVEAEVHKPLLSEGGTELTAQDLVRTLSIHGSSLKWLHKVPPMSIMP